MNSSLPHNTSRTIGRCAPHDGKVAESLRRGCLRRTGRCERVVVVISHVELVDPAVVVLSRVHDLVATGPDTSKLHPAGAVVLPTPIRGAPGGLQVHDLGSGID